MQLHGVEEGDIVPTPAASMPGEAEIPGDADPANTVPSARHMGVHQEEGISDGSRSLVAHQAEQPHVRGSTQRDNLAVPERNGA